MLSNEAVAVPNPPKGWPRIVPHLIYDHPGAAIGWLTRVFGFEERIAARHTTSDGIIGRTQMDVAGSIVTLGPPSIHGGSPASDASTMLYVYVDDVDEHYRHVVAESAHIVTELDDRPWGDRMYQVSDCEGHQWTFAQHVEDVPLDDCTHED